MSVSRAELVEIGARVLREAGIADPRRDSLRLLAAVLSDSVPGVILGAASPVASDHRTQFEQYASRRARHEPIEYITGRAGFRTLELQVDRSVLIPRPETEGLVQLALDWLAERPEPARAADVGTGSGCVALSLATEGNVSSVVATDVSEPALATAVRNLDTVRPEVPVHFVRGSLLEPVAGQRLDLIVSNPPYVAPAEYRELDSGVRDFEPGLALVSEEDGMHHIRMLLRSAREALAAGGALLVEIDARRSGRALQAAHEAGWVHVAVEQDVFGRDRYLVIRG